MNPHLIHIHTISLTIAMLNYQNDVPKIVLRGASHASSDTVLKVYSNLPSLGDLVVRRSESPHQSL